MSTLAVRTPESSPTPPTPARPIIYLGMDVHKDSITIAVLPQGAKAPSRLEKLPKLKKRMDRVARDGEIQACYEASGPGYVLHRAFCDWEYACAVIAPSLIPKRAGVHRKHDKREAADLARLYRAGELGPVRIPSEADERVRDVVGCRETFQREILKSRHYILKFLATRGFVFREGTHWCTPHLKWLQHLTTVTHAWKAQQLVHARFNHLSYRKRPQIAGVAVARELVGFLWAVAREVAPVPSL
ncbi:MAG: transposase [Gemmatimonadota bacterium]|nr:transposase [Gemmatimonadota bacterium]